MFTFIRPKPEARSRSKLLAVAFTFAIVWTATATTVWAVDPALSGTCNAMHSGSPATYGVKATYSATNIPAGITQVNFTIKFQKRVNGGAWEKLRDDGFYNVAVVSGTASDNSGYLPATTPVAGEEWRIFVDAYYETGMPPVRTNIPGVGSLPITP